MKMGWFGEPPHEWFIMENPIKVDDLGGTHISGNPQLGIMNIGGARRDCTQPSNQYPWLPSQGSPHVHPKRVKDDSIYLDQNGQLEASKISYLPFTSGALSGWWCAYPSEKIF